MADIRQGGEEDLQGRRAIVVGASRGFGKGVAEAFCAAGASVLAVSRDGRALAELTAVYPKLQTAVADAADPSIPGQLLDRHQPDILALVAGASPLLRPIHHQTWDTFSLNWHSDVRIAFHWVRETLLKPLRPGSTVIVMSSGAALAGSPLSGGYAGAKATVRFITTYAQQESQRGGLGITFKTVLPKLSPATSLGRPAVAAYAARAGLPEEQFVSELGPAATPQSVGAAFVRLASSSADGEAREFMLTGEGLLPLPTT